MSKLVYFKQIAIWELRYGKPLKSQYDPTEARACCRKCGKMRKHMSRHHKANDFFFALLFPDVFARRYIEFRRKDCDKLCDACHRSVERYYETAKQAMYREFNNMRNRADITVEWCNYWRAEFLKLYEQWLNQPKPKRARKSKSSRLAAKRKLIEGRT